MTTWDCVGVALDVASDDGTDVRMSRGALLRYRVMAYATGVMLLVLVLVAMPLKYVGDDPTWVEVVGPAHGWLYFLYLLAAVWLAYRVRWPVGKTVLVLLAGTIPFASFVAERVVTREVSPLVERPEPRLHGG